MINLGLTPLIIARGEKLGIAEVVCKKDVYSFDQVNQTAAVQPKKPRSEWQGKIDFQMYPTEAYLSSYGKN